jgi:hypothetical protein
VCVCHSHICITEGVHSHVVSIYMLCTHTHTHTHTTIDECDTVCACVCMCVYTYICIYIRFNNEVMAWLMKNNFFYFGWKGNTHREWGKKVGGGGADDESLKNTYTHTHIHTFTHMHAHAYLCDMDLRRSF